MGVRRSGSGRWHHLKAVPLQVIYERWGKPYEAVWAGKLNGLESKLERRHMATEPEASRRWRRNSKSSPGRAGGNGNRISGAALTGMENVHRRGDVLVAAPISRRARRQSFPIEPRLGGEMYEDWGNGEGRVWYTVFAIEKERDQSAGPHGHALRAGAYAAAIEAGGARTGSVAHRPIAMCSGVESAIRRRAEAIGGRLAGGGLDIAAAPAGKPAPPGDCEEINRSSKRGIPRCCASFPAGRVTAPSFPRARAG